MAALYEFINFLDILSFKPELKVKGNSRFVTNLSKTVSLICISSIIIISFFIILDVFMRKTHTIIYNLDSREIPKIKFQDSPIALFLLDAMGKELNQPDRYFNFLVKFWNVEILNNNYQNTTDYKKWFTPKTTIIDLPLKNCSDLNLSKFKTYYENLPKFYPSAVCIDLRNLNYTLFGKYGGNDGYSSLNIHIRRCLNSTAENKTNCFPEDEIDKKLSQIYLNLITIENDINSNNYQNPILEYTKNDPLLISSTIFKTFFKEVNLVRFNSNNGFIFDTTEKFETYRTDKIKESVDLRGKNTLYPGTFSQVNIRSSGKIELFNRSYFKLQESFALIGGIIHVILLLGKMFVYIYSQNAMSNYLFLNLFEYDEIKKIFNKERIIKSKLILNQVGTFNLSDKNLNNLKKDPITFNLKPANSNPFKNNSNSNSFGYEKKNVNEKLFKSRSKHLNESLNALFNNKMNKKENIQRKERDKNLILENNFFSKINDKLDHDHNKDKNEISSEIKFKKNLEIKLNNIIEKEDSKDYKINASNQIHLNNISELKEINENDNSDGKM